MAETRPTGEQLRFVSSATGEHILDTYLEAAEKGGRTLPDLLDDIFDSNGVFDTSNFQFRINSTTRAYQVRVGIFANANDGWTNIPNGFIFRQRGAYANTTAYEQLDVVTVGNSSYVCITAHTSSTATPDLTKFVIIIDGTALNTATTSAQTSATNAATSATSAATSATTATTKASEASTSATNAANSATSAATSASTATTQASSATTSANNAATSATNAAGSATAAAASQSSAATSASAASASQTAAATSATSAANSATSATTSATNASNSASAASASQSAAATSATNAASSATSASTSATTATTKASEAATSATNAAASATSADASKTAAAASQSAAATSATAAAASQSAAATSATNAANSASSASTSATNAAASATTATTGATDAAASAILANDWATKTSSTVAGGEWSAKYHAQQAASSASSASTSASNAAASASSAASAQTAAEAARDATLASFDSFDDRYLGPKANDPTLDNDGNALIAGALYFNTTAGAMKVYTGSAWVAAYVSGTSFLPLVGGTLTGALVLPGDAVNALEAVPKQQLDAGLATKAATSHTHAISDVTNLQTSLDGKAASTHSHTISDVTGLQTALDGKQAAGSYAASTHTHSISDVTGLQTALDGKQAADNDLTAIAALTGTSGFLIKTAADTWALDTSTYLTTSSASSTYQTQSGMSSYLTTTTAATTYLPLAGGALTGGLRDARVAVGTDININAGNYFTKTISGATTFTISNVPPSGTAASFILDLIDGGSATITWWASIKWPSASAPSLTVTGRDVLGFFTHDGGTTWNGFLIAKDIR